MVHKKVHINIHLAYAHLARTNFLEIIIMIPRINTVDEVKPPA